MKLWPIAIAIASWLAVGLSSVQEEPWVLVIGGDTSGYLSPCGCTKPMIGGIRRRITLMRALSSGKNALILENGGLISGTGRQDELKAETVAECLRSAGVDAITFGYSEARFGKGMMLTLNQLSRGKLVNSAIKQSATNELQPWVEKGPFLVGAFDVRTNLVAGALGESEFAGDSAAKLLAQEAIRRGLVPVLMLQGARQDAEKLAGRVPELRLIVFRSDGNASEAPVSIGSTLLVSPGGKGLYVCAMRYSGGRFSQFSAVRVEADVKNDPDAARLFKSYLLRIEQERLLEKAPRTVDASFAGTKNCGSCHGEALKVWMNSGHSHALRALEKVGQSKDPECVGCHVVGLTRKNGFVSTAKTPDLANVGCESCHGAGASHSVAPLQNKMGRVGELSCMSCHRPEQSPGFDFPKFWKRIEHK